MVKKFQIEGDDTFVRHEERKSVNRFVEQFDFDKFLISYHLFKERYVEHETRTKAQFDFISADVANRLLLEQQKTEAQFSEIKFIIRNYATDLRALRDSVCTLQPGIENVIAWVGSVRAFPKAFLILTAKIIAALTALATMLGAFYALGHNMGYW